MDRFEQLHPGVLLLYFLSVFLITMFTKNPLLIGLSLISGAVYAGVLRGRRAVMESLWFYSAFFVLIALVNPLVSHNGVTPLFFLNGNAVTLESVLYGVNLAGMLAAVFLWFRCFNTVMTSEKLLFLIGGLSPKIALVLSSALRFLPLYLSRAALIRKTERAMGLYASDGWIDRLKGTVRMYSALVTWSLENAVDTGNSMKSRGYRLKGKSRFSLFRFGWRDALMLPFVLIPDALFVSAKLQGLLDFTFYPRMVLAAPGPVGTAAVCLFGLMTFLPLLIKAKESIRWAFWKSAI
ncbi:MAG: energy-coupling factor transporter transmembrane protein EcfT [Lachnospiraceae bacterium]|nr:energy-coupling factor transporter transmembrane protein EcfT [Lachnospiraceae bacterium]